MHDGLILRIRAGPNLTPQSVFTPFFIGRFGFNKVGNKRKGFGRHVTKINHLVAMPAIAGAADVVLVGLDDERSVRFQILEFKRILTIKDATNALGLIPNVRAQNHVNAGAGQGPQRGLPVVRNGCYNNNETYRETKAKKETSKSQSFSYNRMMMMMTTNPRKRERNDLWSNDDLVESTDRPNPNKRYII